MVQMIDSLQAVPVPQDKASARGEKGHQVPRCQLSPLGTKRTYDLSAPGGDKFQASCRLQHSKHLHMLHVGGNAGSATDRTQRFDTNTDVCMRSHEAASLDQAADPQLTFLPAIFFPSGFLFTRKEKRVTARRNPHVRCLEGCDRAESEQSALSVMALPAGFVRRPRPRRSVQAVCA